MKSQALFNAVRSVEMEFDIAWVAVQALVGTSLRDDAFIREKKISMGGLLHCRKMLEVTYTIRLYSEYEAGLRDFWRDGMNRKTHPRMEHLIDSVGAYRGIPNAVAANAHSVRNYRNALIHHAKSTSKLTLKTCRSHLNCFMSFLPLQW